MDPNPRRSGEVPHRPKISTSTNQKEGVCMDLSNMSQQGSYLPAIWYPSAREVRYTYNRWSTCGKSGQPLQGRVRVDSAPESTQKTEKAHEPGCMAFALARGVIYPRAHHNQSNPLISVYDYSSVSQLDSTPGESRAGFAGNGDEEL